MKTCKLGIFISIFFLLFACKKEKEESDVETDEDVTEEDAAGEDIEVDRHDQELDQADGEDQEGGPECGDGVVDGDEECDDGNDVAGDGCENDCTFTCVSDADCSDGNICNGLEVCDGDDHVCQAGIEQNDGFVCEDDPRSVCISGACQESVCGDGIVDTGGGEFCEPPDAGTCNSQCHWICTTSSDCPDDGNICNGSETCDTTAHQCISVDPLSDGTACGSDPRRICLAGSCQESLCGDSYTDTEVSEECDDANAVEGDGCDNDCTWSCHTNLDCDDGHDCTDDQCDITLHRCSSLLSLPDKTCRVSEGPCDLSENCNGVDQDCPADAFLPSSTICRDAAGFCDAVENCSGSSASCPDDVLRPATFACREQAGDCDVTENCTGTSASCPADVFEPATTICRDSAGSCDVAEQCTGTSAACPADSFQPSTVLCRDAAGVCDFAEFCTGTMAVCPVDGFRPITTECRPSNGVCDVAEHCPGTSASCPPDGFESALTLCRAAADVCDTAEYCTGSDAGCPADAFEPITTVCRSSAGICDAADHCTGTSAPCPADAFLPGSTECRASAGICDRAENCTGSSASCPADSYFPDTTLCRPSADTCDVAENCTGLGVSCPADLFRPATYECRGSTGDCDLAESCTGSSAVCPTDLFADSGDPCSDANSCSIGDQCDGLGSCSAETVLMMALGANHSCALFENGSVRCWGYNAYGQLGNGTTTNSLTAVGVTGLSSGVVYLVAGSHHTCAVTSTGGAKCWGINDYGQLGDGSRVNRLTPVDVTGLTSGVSTIVAGRNHSCALLGTGAVKCWGRNDSGGLGDGTFNDSNLPVDVVGLSSGVSVIALAQYHTCAVVSGGGLKCWGWNFFGQIGDGTTTNRNVPTDVTGLSSGVALPSLGWGQSCALTTSGGVKCWGRNALGELGDGTTTIRYVPGDVLGLTSGVTSIAVGWRHGCALLSAGTVKCWGDNAAGQVGDGTTTMRLSPVDVVGLPSTTIKLFSGGAHSCVMLDDLEIMCWGFNDFGQVGDGTTTNRSSPVYTSC